MGKKNARAGGKFGGGHTTVVPAAGVIADIAAACSVVTKVSVGFIKAGLPSAKGLRRVKVVSSSSSLLLSVRDNVSQQELRVYASDVDAAKQYILKNAAKAGFSVAE